MLDAAIIVVGLVVFASYGDPAAGVDDAPGSDWLAAILVIGAACAALLLFANRGSLSMRAALLGTQLSLSTGRLVPSVAAVSVVSPIVSVMLGAFVLQERLEKDPPWHAVVAVGALCVALLGAVVISSAKEGRKEVEETAPEPRAALV
jgi:cytochrome c biogenesis factor